MLHELPTISLPLGKRIYKLFVATSPEQKIKGLSGIDHLAPNEGMIFPYDNEEKRTFQFRDTLLPLKVYFIGANGKVLQKSSAKPGQFDAITCPVPCKWVIEVLDRDS